MSVTAGAARQGTMLPTPLMGAEVVWVQRHLGHLALEPKVRASPEFRGGQSAADVALAAFDVTGYARARNEVWPERRRGASRLSPYIRHGLIDLPTLWAHVAAGPAGNRDKYRDELLWQEYARHLHARIGDAMRQPLRYEPARRDRVGQWGWNREMACVDLAVGEARDQRLAGQPDPDVARLAVVRAGRVRLAGRGRTLRAPPARRVGGRQPAGLAVDRRHRHGEAVRLQPLAGTQARPRPLPDLPAQRPLPHRWLARL